MEDLQCQGVFHFGTELEYIKFLYIVKHAVIQTTCSSNINIDPSL